LVETRLITTQKQPVFAIKSACFSKL